jgi:hypothetical protein
MFVKLDFKSETKKAYQLHNESWIPKSILDDRGLKPPYYAVKDWWLSACIEKIQNEDKQITNVLLGIKPLVVNFRDIPVEIRQYWSTYWKKLSDGLNQSTPDYEPRLWGNDCFEGEMSSWF